LDVSAIEVRLKWPTMHAQTLSAFLFRTRDKGAKIRYITVLQWRTEGGLVGVRTSPLATPKFYSSAAVTISLCK